jgi:signal peptidase I
MMKDWELISKWLLVIVLVIIGFVTGCSQTKDLPEDFPASPGTFHVAGNSMEPNVSSGQMLIVDPEAYQSELPARGDIIIFTRSTNPDLTFAKRIIGLPMEEIEIKNQTVWINSQQLEEAYIQQSPTYSGKWTMSEQEYFVLSDNRNNGSDSHHWGGLPFKNIIGKVTHICSDNSVNTCQTIEEKGN